MTDASSQPDAAQEEDDGQLLERYIARDQGIVKDRWGEPLVGSSWFILSLKWYKQWKIFKGKVNITEENVDRRAPGPIDNSDILQSPETYYATQEGSQYDRVMRNGVALNLDYVIIPPAAWELLKNKYGVLPGSEIPRFSIQQSAVRTFIELVLREFRLVVVFPDFTLIEPKSIFVSRKQKIRELIERVAKVISTPEKQVTVTDLTLWELDSSSGLDGLKDRISRRESNKPVELLGKRLVSQDETMDEADLPMLATIIAEVREPNTTEWLFSRDVNQFRCEGCRRLSFGVPLKCDCGKVIDYTVCILHTELSAKRPVFSSVQDLFVSVKEPGGGQSEFSESGE